jgi:hypothetical protein
MTTWKLTVRHGPAVEHQRFDDLDEAVVAMRQRALEIRSEGPARPASMLRQFKPEDQVRARFQLSGGGRLPGGPTAGVDLRGDGTFVPYSGGLKRTELDPTDYDTPFDVVRETLQQAR